MLATPAREACEIHGLIALQDYVTAARAGAAFDSLGPLLALSLVDVAGARLTVACVSIAEWYSPLVSTSHRAGGSSSLILNSGSSS